MISVLHDCSQKAHVQQFLATEDALNKAAEARDLCQKFINRLHGGTTQNMSNLRQLEVIFVSDLWLLVTNVIVNCCHTDVAYLHACF